MGQEFRLFGSQLFSCKCSVSIYHMNETVCVPGIPPNVPCPPPGEEFYFGSCCCPALTTPGTCQEADWLPLIPSPQRRGVQVHPYWKWRPVWRRGWECSAATPNTSRIQPLLTAPPQPLQSSCHPLSPGSLQEPPPPSQGHPVKQQVLSLLCLKPSSGSHLTQKI